MALVRRLKAGMADRTLTDMRIIKPEQGLEPLLRKAGQGDNRFLEDPVVIQLDSVVQLLRHGKRHFRRPPYLMAAHFVLVCPVLVAALGRAVFDQFTALCSGYLLPAMQA